MFVFVNVFVTDENGTVVPDADDLINFKVAHQVISRSAPNKCFQG